MSKKSVIKMTAMAAAFAATAVPMAASAEISGSLSAANFYLWRGMDVSGGGAQVAGDLNFSHETGLYAGIWASSAAPSATGGEYDVYAGWGGEFSGLSIDLSYWDYNYPNDDGASVGNSLGDVVVSLGFAGVTATAYLGQGECDDCGPGPVEVENDYYTLSYSYDKYGILVGTWKDDFTEDDPTTAGVDETVSGTHVDISYTPVENLTFTASKMIDEDDDAAGDAGDDLLIHVGYSFPL